MTRLWIKKHKKITKKTEFYDYNELNYLHQRNLISSKVELWKELKK